MTNKKLNFEAILVGLGTALVAVVGVMLRDNIEVAQFLAIVITCGIVVFSVMALPRHTTFYLRPDLTDLSRKLTESIQLGGESKSRITRMEDRLNDICGELVEGSTERMSWARFWATVRTLQEIVEADTDFKPDVVLSVGRTGAIVGSLLAGNMGCIRHLGIDRIDHWAKEGGTYTRTVEIVPPPRVLSDALQKKKVLCVMPECNTGRTLHALMQELQALHVVGEARTAVLYRNVNTFFKPDYIAIEDNGKRPNFPFRTEVWRDDSKSPREGCA